MIEKDKKEFKSIISETIDEKVSPQFQEVRKEIRTVVCDAIDEVISPQLEEIREDLSDVKGDLSSFKEQNDADHQELFHSLDRIERKLDSNISRTDDHSIILNQHTKRLTKLEAEI